MLKFIKSKNISVLGLLLCLLYICIIAYCLIESMGDIDEKSRFVLLQIPLVFQMAAIVELGLAPYLKDMNWTTAYLTIVPLTLLFLYAVGNVAEKLIRIMASKFYYSAVRFFKKS